MQTTGLQMHPTYEYHDYSPPVLTGYRVTQRAQVTVRELAEGGKAVSAAIESGGNGVRATDLRLGISDPEAALAKARDAAVEAATAKAEQYAAATGQSLGDVLGLREVTSSSGGSRDLAAEQHARGVRRGGGGAAHQRGQGRPERSRSRCSGPSPNRRGMVAADILAAMATTNDLKNGMVLKLDGQLWQVMWFQHHKPGKGGAVVRTKLRAVESGKTVDKTFNADVKVEVASVDKRTMQYLYNDGTSYVFMDTATFDQLEIDPAIVGDAKNFLLENGEAVVATNEGRVLYIEMPASVELEITYTEPGVVGDSATGRTKPATVETGHQIQVPLFINQGERVKVDTRDSSYLGRVKG